MFQRDIDSLMDRLSALGARVVELEEKVAFLMEHQSAAYVPVSLEQKVGVDAEVVELLRKGKMSDALRVYREKHQVLFEDAQKAIEALRNKYAA
jgi:hypothetical protein